MHRTQIYFDEILFEEIKQQSKRQGLSLSAYIRETVEADLAHRGKVSGNVDLSEFAGMWEGKDVTQTSLRKDAWK